MTGGEGRSPVHVRLNSARLWRWQRELVSRLADHPHIDLRVSFIDGPALPRAFVLLTILERFAFRLVEPHACDPLKPDAFAGRWLASHEVGGAVLDLSGEPSALAQSGVIRLLYDGSTSDDAVLSAALEGRGPELSAVDAGTGRLLGSARPAIEDPAVLTRALDCIFSALLRLCVKVLTAPAPDSGEAIEPRSAGSVVRTPAVVSFGMRTLIAKLDHRLKRLCGRAPQWFVAWRHIDDEHDAVTLPEAGAYRRLPDDGSRYYADPFLLNAGGKRFLFVEEYAMATAKGIISAATFDPATGFGQPRPVLETASHLSYPLVFAHDGHVWMIPESLQTRSVELYRASRLPDVWVHEATLLEGIEASDATVLQDGGLWWMFVATRDWLGSNWDMLSVFWAERLQGPWHPHADNPIVIDSRCARPAGHFFRHDGALWRPAQDCSDGYGAGLAVCRIEQLDRDAVRQSIHSIVRLRSEGVSRGPHTLNRAGGIEVIDLYGARS